MNIKVTKRSGTVVELELEKWQAQVAKVCEGVSDVSQSMIEITSQPHFFDGITTREIDELTDTYQSIALLSILLMKNKTQKLDIQIINMLQVNNVYLCYVKMYMVNINRRLCMKL